MIWKASDISGYWCLRNTKLKISVIFGSTTHSIVRTSLAPQFDKFVIIERSVSFCTYILAVKLIKLNWWHSRELGSWFTFFHWAVTDKIWPKILFTSFIYTIESAINLFSFARASLIVSWTHYRHDGSLLPVACFHPNNLGVEFRPTLRDVETHHQYDNMKTKYKKAATNS